MDGRVRGGRYAPRDAGRVSRGIFEMSRGLFGVRHIDKWRGMLVRFPYTYIPEEAQIHLESRGGVLALYLLDKRRFVTIMALQ